MKCSSKTIKAVSGRVLSLNHLGGCKCCLIKWILYGYGTGLRVYLVSIVNTGNNY